MEMAIVVCFDCRYDGYFDRLVVVAFDLSPLAKELFPECLFEISLPVVNLIEVSRGYCCHAVVFIPQVLDHSFDIFLCLFQLHTLVGKPSFVVLQYRDQLNFMVDPELNLWSFENLPDDMFAFGCRRV